MTPQTKEDASVSSRDVEAHPGTDPGGRVFCPTDQPTLHHVSLFVSDLEASTKFYTTGLGLTLREEFQDIIGRGASSDFPFGVASVFLEAGNGRYVELHPAGAGAMSPPGFPMNHLALGVVDVDAAYACLSEGETSLGYGKEQIQLWANLASRPVQADMESGLHFCFVAPTRKSVDAFHKAALAAGGHDNGKPGLRADYGEGYYAAFVIDPDGYRIEAYCAGR